MYTYEWDPETGGLLLQPKPAEFSKEPRPVYYQELDLLGFDKYWDYEKDDRYPYMWAEANSYYYRGNKVAQIKGGSLINPPELIILDNICVSGKKLQFVDISTMISKNRSILDSLIQETIKKIYNTYLSYHNKVNIIYVAFSGGKDSIVTLDLVQKALPHNAFKVVFGNTDMELPTTLELIHKVSDYCNENKIDFIQAQADFSSEYSWKRFGPPARRLRWCCTVHKTAPVINKLRELCESNRFQSIMITGVRASESASRADYSELSLGKKMAGQYSFHPIIEWNSAELYLYIFANNLLINEAYKYGFSRVGCIMCPNSTERNEYLKMKVFPQQTEKYCNLIIETSSKDLSGANKDIFLDTGGWKTRFSGRELVFSEQERFSFTETSSQYLFSVINLKDDWKIWYKTIGILDDSDPYYNFEFDGVWRSGKITQKDNISIISIEKQNTTKNSIDFISLFKSILAKSQYCIRCGTCEAECPNGCILMKNDHLVISDKCVKCRSCLKIDNGCLYYNSIKGSKDMKSVKGINRYLSVGVNAHWIEEYINDNSFEPGNRKTDTMFSFLSDAGMVVKKKLTDFGKLIQDHGLHDDAIWALMLCNLAYSPAFSWYIHNIPFNEEFTEYRLEGALGDEVSKKAKGEFWNGFKVILTSNDAFQRIGFGIPTIETIAMKSGETKTRLEYITRLTWFDPDPRVILFSLYKFAEACDGYYQFSLTRLLDHEIESAGVSPTQIFGLDRGKMEEIIKGLSVNYPEFISSSFSLGLDTITLNRDKTSADVLELF